MKNHIENKCVHLKWKTKKNQMGFLILSLQFWPKNPYFRLDNFPFFSSDFPVRNFSSTNFPFSRFSWEIAMPTMYIEIYSWIMFYFVLKNSVTWLGIAISHEKRENGKFVDEKFLTGKSDEKNGKLSSLKLGIFG